MGQMKGSQAGTFSPKRLYNTNKKTEELQNFALGLIADCNDAEKTIAQLELSVLVFSSIHQYIYCLNYSNISFSNFN
jgi:hypothetical protein